MPVITLPDGSQKKFDVPVSVAEVAASIGAGLAKAAHEFCAEATWLPARANGQVAIAYYHRDASTGRYTPAAIDVITLEGVLIKDITAFVTPQVFPRFGLPAEFAP